MWQIKLSQDMLYKAYRTYMKNLTKHVLRKLDFPDGPSWDSSWMLDLGRSLDFQVPHRLVVRDVKRRQKSRRESLEASVVLYSFSFVFCRPCATWASCRQVRNQVWILESRLWLDGLSLFDCILLREKREGVGACLG